jgi:hypothetical protein
LFDIALKIRRKLTKYIQKMIVYGTLLTAFTDNSELLLGGVPMSFAEMVKEHRSKKKMTLSELAEKTGINKSGCLALSRND